MNALIFNAIRTPRGAVRKNGGALAQVKPIELMSQLLQAMPARSGIEPEQVEDLVLGCVTQIKEQGANLARIAALYAGWPDHVPGMVMNRFCTSGLDACAAAAARISAGECILIAAGGVESMSMVPMFSDKGDWFTDPAVMRKTRFTPLGVSADLLATLEGLSREELDQYALESQNRAVKAREKKSFQSSLVPILDADGDVLLSVDEPPRAGLTLDKLASLPPAFQEFGEKGFDQMLVKAFDGVAQINHLHTAGNSPAPADGAALVMIGSDAFAASSGLKPRARILSYATAAADPMLMLTAAESATEKALAKSNLTMAQMDRLEVNEAFAATVIRYIRRFNIDSQKINPNGGAIAFGHAMGATGSMLIAQLLDELDECNGRYGLVSVAGGGGLGTAMVVERLT
ncbi:MAG: acetyl-CoA C-acyltransferase [Aliidiomarina sp.]|uniref:acetyl-CoA C-acyltransferase n=1 Tax=Aliidiomarina sp. TaxID=1872439 RepID=UPI0025B99FC8|nr:acetyl-CoA C-acyltransferase [Aliidiomarina sp.]MCH8501193.1 acetyl-CoA C-acyltransferase [Aliidiomarina sp.]